MPRITCPTWDNILHAETTRAKDGSFINSCSWGRHFLSSERSTLVPNRSILGPVFPVPPGPPPPPELPLLFRRTTLPVESFESESDKLLLWIPAAFSRSSWRQNIISHSLMNTNYHQVNKQILPSSSPGMMRPGTVHTWQLWCGIYGWCKPILCGLAVDPNFHPMSVASGYAPPHCDLDLLQQVSWLKISPDLQTTQQTMTATQKKK
jgi:hypothetical protein